MDSIIYAVLIIAGIYLVIGIPGIIVSWALINKAGRPGWSQIIPFYGALVSADIVGKRNLAIILMISDALLYLILIAVLIMPSISAAWIIILAILLLFMSQGMRFAISMRLRSRFTIVDSNGAPTQNIRIRNTVFILMNLQKIRYRSEEFIVANPEKVVGSRMVGYEKTDYVPAGFDKVAVASGWASIMILPLLPVAPVSLVLGIVALNRINQHPERKGRVRAWFATIWGALWSVVLVYVIYYLATHMPNS